MQLALFDLDLTLLPIDSADTWSRHILRRGGLDPNTYGARVHEFARSYESGTFDVDGYARFQMELLARFPRASLDAWHAEFMEVHVRPHVRREARALVDRHRRMGHELALVTGTNAYVVAPIAREFDIEHVLAIEPEVKDGEFTGDWVGTTTHQAGKVRKVEEWLDRRGLTWSAVRTTFYSDSIHDLPLLERVNEPVVTNGDARLNAVARQRGWQTMQLFDRAAE
jgi:HAD superfamily hydrolase (TIGR01490 family)